MFSPAGPFHRRDALDAGVTDTQLRGRRYRRLFQGVYVLATLPLDLTTWIRSALLALPDDSVVSHVTAMHLYGVDIGPPWPLHFSTRSATHSRLKGLKIHQRQAPISSRLVEAVPATSPNRTLVDIATKVSLVELVTAAEWLIHRRLTTLASLSAYAMDRHLHGVRPLRRVLGLVRERVESPRETVLRLMIRFAHLPEPQCNVVIRDAHRLFLARGDLVYADWRIVVEYDGWYHERSAQQRQSDVLRREGLEHHGWKVIVVTSADLRDPREVVHRVHRALVSRGWTGPEPTFSIMWDSWFAPRAA
ncbi:DUF559 domain-containing protein [Aeromicrobium stalagmiti]|uniref:DUF559 domain-containing protein n=1 Tax=Aeromicrobium stalagmiti TaxID=2738988 RepID=UPI0015683D1A|nr:DUF559 domain-containing protein [Aeromicrobium stalagmiti]NRQ49103.1 DUF559 domain-containing protein [Aeromicrobium stalagmiti]